mgnify:CR=1 FL=1
MGRRPFVVTKVNSKVLPDEPAVCRGGTNAEAGNALR